MILNYIKTSLRNLIRNKLFSSINIIGLAVSMSVGLMLIAFITDLQSFDRFNENGERIYRIASETAFNGEHETKFASTSIKAGKLIRDKVTGIEEVGIMRNGFSQDAKVDHITLPLKGYWAEPSILNIFSFPMLEGDSSEALKNPYSIVLTETAAKKLFGDSPAVGRALRFEDTNYQVTGVLEDVPFFSHLNFEALVSFSTVEQLNKGNKEFNSWANNSSNLVYILKQDNVDIASIENQLDAIAKEENRIDPNANIQLDPIPLYNLVVGEKLLSMERSGPYVPPQMIWLLVGLSIIVILSACFNYAILTVARSMRRFKEVGLRKAIGAGKAHVRQQFLAEAVIISFASLILSFVLFLALRPKLIDIAPEIQHLIKLELTPTLVISFIGFALCVGVIAGFMPALYFSNINVIKALKNEAVAKALNHVSLRRALIVIQYSLTLIFITSTAIGYVQYKDILTYDLGFDTDNILNIDMQGNESTTFVNDLKGIPEVNAVSRSMIVTSVGNAWGGYMKYDEPLDSLLVMTNNIDENYMQLHNYKLVAGSNFTTKPISEEQVNELIVNEEFLRAFNIGDGNPEKALGEKVTFSNFKVHDRKMSIVGVMKDFHYGKIDNVIGPTAFMPLTSSEKAMVNVKLSSADLSGTMSKIEDVWKKIDPVHPIEAEFYNESIEQAYSEYSTMIKIIGFLSFLAITIASMGLFGMVVFTTEIRLREMSIRKVLGASSGSLMYQLSRGFAVLLFISALIAIPPTYLFFEKYVLTHFPYHTPVQVPELITGLLAVFFIAFIMIGSQTLKAAKSNPAKVLKSE